ncbi:hypothetical protein [Streptomyces gilvosporeus]|uniref:Integral membrane protein n=1 Tax=Streptomyces gilvosporeus TaxID=553510 RepID=A0A1V0TU67_9ACTN|nr:hypothetical protein [Streptomyces gilvosporeus]ARF56476.1 hypothetical protein B1H19_21900 [Streptomyces gilvosporeus]
MSASLAPTARAAADLRLLRAAVFTAVCVALSATGHMIASFAAVPLWTLGVGCAAVFAVAAPLAGRERSLPGIATALAVGQLALHAVFAMGQHPMRMPGGGARTGGLRGLSDQAAVLLARHVSCGLEAGRVDGAQARRVLGSGGYDTAVAGGLVPPAGPGGMSGAAAHQMAGGAAMAHCLVPSLPMVLGHLLAALGAGWLLRRGEAALWRLVRLSAPAAREIAAQALMGTLRGALALVGALISGLATAHDGPRRAPVSYGDDKPGPQGLALHHSVVRRGPPAPARLALAA